jgi:SMP-30/gluconolaconase/LRE-like protein
VRRHASAATAAPARRQVIGLGGFVRGGRATRASSRRADRSGAPARRHGLALGLLLTLFAALLGSTASTALAGQTRVPLSFSPIAGAGSGLTIGTPGGIALDETSTNVFLNDGTTKTDILGAENGAPVGLVAPLQITGLTFPSVANGIAVDNSATSPNKGTLYIVSGSAPPKIKIFRRSAVNEKYEAAGELLDTASGATNAAGAAVDAHGNLFVGDFGSQSVVKFNTAGTLEKTYKLNTTVVRPEAVAVDAAGDLFVARPSNGQVFKYPADALGEISPTNFVEVLPKLSKVTGIAVDPAKNALFAALGSRVVEYDATTLVKKLEFGLGRLGTTTRLTVNSVKNWVYVSDNGTGKKNVAVFGPPVPLPTVFATAASEVTGTKATLNGIVNPEGMPVTECFFEWGEKATEYEHKTTSCEGTIGEDTENYPVSVGISGLAPNGKTYHYRLVAKNANGIVESTDKTLVTANTVATEAASGIGATGATLHGALRPESHQYTGCLFEYGLTTSAGFEDTAPCSPPPSSIEADFAVHPVSAALAELRSNATYKFRLTATNAKFGPLSGEVLTFTTLGPPQITEVRASFADQSSATLEAKINPSGFGTSYRFEWGPTASYGNNVPVDFEPFLGSGETPVGVNAKISGLSPGTAFHYRVVATNSVDLTASPDQILETLDSCGLPEGRCFELVSPRDVGPVASSHFPAGTELHYQAAAGSGSLAYAVEAGFPDSTKGSEILYHGTRDSSGWSSTQLSPPILVRNETDNVASSSAMTLGLSENLSCGVVVSNQPLTSDASTRLVVEAGGSNLYRHNPDGSNTAISKLAPENADIVEHTNFQTEYALDGFSTDCGKVAFVSPYHYPGVAGVDLRPPLVLDSVPGRFYEWDHGILRSVGSVPGPSGEVAVDALAGTGENHSNVVSTDGSRVFFTALRQTSPNSEEIGKIGVFVREGGVTTRDLSLSETSTPDEGATYQFATKDGSRVFFTANAGLTDESSEKGKDLYEYNLEDEDLTDLSVDDDAGGAEVGGFVGASEDGSHVYFVAQGQLVPGRGKTSAENQDDGTYSLFGASVGVIDYVGTVNADEFTTPSGGVTVTRQNVWSSRVSPDGLYLAFETRANVTGYDSGGAKEAYLYDADADSEATICISCRQDGRPSVSTRPPLAIFGPTNPLSVSRTLVDDGGEARVFFSSADALALGAQEGQTNLYEWSHGQIFEIAAEPAGHTTKGTPDSLNFADASIDGTDVYFDTLQTLNWEDGDGRSSVYDARVGGGFPEPPPAAKPCDPTSEGSCQRAAPPAGVPAQTPASSSFNGPGKVNTKAKHKKRHKRHHKKHKTRNARNKRHGNGDRRAGK